VVLVARAASGADLNALDGLVEAVLTHTVDWVMTGVDAPSLVTVNAQDVLGTVIGLAKPGRI
jgi:hypothetical protein